MKKFRIIGVQLVHLRLMRMYHHDYIGLADSVEEREFHTNSRDLCDHILKLNQESIDEF